MKPKVKAPGSHSGHPVPDEPPKPSSISYHDVRAIPRPVPGAYISVDGRPGAYGSAMAPPDFRRRTRQRHGQRCSDWNTFFNESSGVEEMYGAPLPH